MKLGLPGLSQLPQRLSSLPYFASGTADLNALLDASLTPVIPSGIYNITAPLNLRNNHVIAATPGQVVLKADPSLEGHIGLGVDINVSISGLTFDGNAAQRTALEGDADAALLILVGGTIELENNTFRYAPSQAIWTYRVPGIQVVGNSFQECYQPIRHDCNNLAGGLIENNTFTNTAAYKSIQHVDVFNSTGLVVRGNTMRGAGLQEPTSHGFEGTWGNSIYLMNCTDYLVENNDAGQNHWSAIVSGSGSSDGVVSSNTLHCGTATTAAFWIEQAGAEFITVDDNIIYGGLSCGDTGGDNLTITNNTIHGQGWGINLNAGCKVALVQGNTVVNSLLTKTDNGLFLWEKSTVDVDIDIIGNHFEGFNYGIAINNTGGVGDVYGINIATDNTYANNNQDVWVSPGITFHDPNSGPGDTGWLSMTSASSPAGTGQWVDFSNLSAREGNTAGSASSTMPAGGTHQPLRVLFTPSIPSGATITGIEFRWFAPPRSPGGTFAGFNSVLWYNGGLTQAAPSNLPFTGNVYGADGYTEGVGTPTSLWGRTWTPAELNAGATISLEWTAGAACTIYMDHIQMRVHYS